MAFRKSFLIRKAGTEGEGGKMQQGREACFLHFDVKLNKTYSLFRSTLVDYTSRCLWPKTFSTEGEETECKLMQACEQA